MQFLDERVELYNQTAFIKKDPISIPHLFTKRQDIEISGLFAAVFSWGNRTTIIRKSMELMELMNYAPYEFICRHDKKDLEKLMAFSHRTFNSTDLLYFVEFLHHHYTGKIKPGIKKNDRTKKDISLESAFSHWMDPNDPTIEKALAGFHQYFFSLEDAPTRTKKHIATPERGSSCKRLNMFLRWMVRKDKNGVDFGLWQSIQPAQLVCPLDLHVARVARRFRLLQRPATDWLAAMELTGQLRQMDSNDPVKYDFALFGLGIEEHF
jgi:uncharacterized protein (TIGR02757 family)